MTNARWLAQTAVPMDSNVSLRYTGPAVEAGVMDVYQASANMIAFTEFVVAASRLTFGPDVSTKAEIKAFARGSFSTDLVINVAGATASVFATVSPSDLWTVVKEAVALWKHLRGNKPSKVEHHGQHVTITNNNGQVINVQTASMTLVFSDKGAEAASQFIKRGLDGDGMEAVEVRADGKLIAEVPQGERNFFVPVAPSTEVTNVTFNTAVLDFQYTDNNEQSSWLW